MHGSSGFTLNCHRSCNYTLWFFVLFCFRINIKECIVPKKAFHWLTVVVIQPFYHSIGMTDQTQPMVINEFHDELEGSRRSMRSMMSYEDHSELWSKQFMGLRQATKLIKGPSYEVYDSSQSSHSDQATRPMASYKAQKVTKSQSLRQATRPTKWQSHKVYGKLLDLRQVTSATASYKAYDELQSTLRATKPTTSYKAHEVIKLGSPGQATVPVEPLSLWSRCRAPVCSNNLITRT